jgi:hypothetical protein
MRTHDVCVCTLSLQYSFTNALDGCTTHLAPKAAAAAAAAKSAAAHESIQALSKTAQRALHSPDAPAAAAPSGTVRRAPVAGSRPIGERFQTGAEPRNNTAAQRSWMYTQDPVSLQSAYLMLQLSTVL